MRNPDNPGKPKVFLKGVIQKNHQRARDFRNLSFSAGGLENRPAGRRRMGGGGVDWKRFCTAERGRQYRPMCSSVNRASNRDMNGAVYQGRL